MSETANSSFNAKNGWTISSVGGGNGQGHAVHRQLLEAWNHTIAEADKHPWRSSSQSPVQIRVV